MLAKRAANNGTAPFIMPARGDEIRCLATGKRKILLLLFDIPREDKGLPSF
jgi:hypothetical protein